MAVLPSDFAAVMHGVAIYGGVVVVAALSGVVGQALLRVSGFDARMPVAPAIGVVALIVVADDTIRLPGAGLTAIGAWALVGVVSLIVLHGRVAAPSPDMVVVFALVVIVGSLPYLANGRFGFVGTGIVDDMALHGTWAEGLRTGNPFLTASLGDYPTGGHALAGAIASLTVTTAQFSFDAVLLIVPALTGVAALAAMQGLGRWSRLLAATLSGIPFLIAGHISRANFKEPIVAMALLAFVLLLRRGTSRRTVAGLALGVVIAGTAETDGLTAVLWFIGIVLVWAVVVVTSDPGAARRRIRAAIRSVQATTIVAVTAMLPEATHLLNFSANTSTGGFPNLVSMRALLGPWISGQLQLPPSSQPLADALSALGTVAAVFSLTWWLRRRDYLVPAGVAGCFILYLAVRQVANPYITTKALAEGAPLMMVMITRPLLSARRSSSLPRVARYTVVVAAATFTAASLWSSITVLRNANVGSHVQDEELAKIRAIARGKPTLFLGVDDFFLWQLRGTVPLNTAGAIPFPLRAGVPPTALMDIDAVAPGWLARADYLLQTRTEFASAMPSNWRLVTTTRLYELWERIGRDRPRLTLASGSGFGAMLDCKTFKGLRISRMNGRALVRPEPILGGAWMAPDGAPLPSTGLPAGDIGIQRLPLPPGSWSISLQYQSPVEISIRSRGMRVRLPANLDPMGPYWPVGDVTSRGQPIEFTLSPVRPVLPISERSAYLGGLVATRLGGQSRMVTLSRACGQYVDWYEVGAVRAASRG